ncbi:hypothetical protein C4577_00110 [Candidatus Parcubacteria bacterium]|nr:MAG: hypothetical protein C4577_00110 [Candidatus Parcubacteria bacterium]
MRKIVALLIIIGLVLIIKNMIFSIGNLIQNDKIVSSLKAKLTEKNQENKFLQEKLFYVKSNDFVEKEARTKLSLTKKGEFIVIMPSSEASAKTDIISTTPNWQKWWNLFF